MDLDLKDVIPCPKCGYEAYEEDFKNGECPRCGASVDEEDEEEDDDDGGSARGSKPKGRGKRGARGAPRVRKARGAKSGSGKSGSGKGGRKGAAPPQKQKVILTEEFKGEVFGALRRGEPREAQTLCFDLADGNEEHAKQIYSYLLGVAKKKGWVGNPGAGPAGGGGAGGGQGLGDMDKTMPLPPMNIQPMPVQPMQVQPMQGMPGQMPMQGMQGMPIPVQPLQGQVMPMQPLPGMPGQMPMQPLPGMPGQMPMQPLPGMPGQMPMQGIPGQMPLALPPGMPGSSAPLPLPPGMPGGPPLPGQGMQGQGMQGQGMPLPLPAGMPGSPIPSYQSDPTLHMPAGGLEHSMEEFASPGQGQPGQQALLPRGAAPMPGPRSPSGAHPAPTSGTPQAAAAAPPDPEEQGFLARVAIEGRHAQVSLLCRAGRSAAAKDLAQSTLARAPDAPRARVALGEALAALGEDAEALQAYLEAVRMAPNDVFAVRGYAQMLVRLGRHSEAVGAFQRIVGPGKGELRDAVALAGALRKSGNVGGAMRVIEEVVKRDPQSLEPLRQAGESLAAGGDLDGAGAKLAQLLEREDPPYTLALALAESLVGRCSPSAKARVACAQVFSAVDRPFAAMRLVAPVAAKQPNDMAARRVLGLALGALGAGPQAEENLRAVVAQGGGGDVEVLRALGRVYLQRGDLDSAITALRRVRDLAPNDVDAVRALARAQVAKGDLDGAIQALTQVHEQVGTDDAALQDELDRLTERAFARRIKALEARLVADEDDAEARLELAQVFAQQGDLFDAIRHVERVASIGPEQLSDALKLAKQLASDDPDARPLVALRARLLDQAQQHARAISLLEAYLEQHPDDMELRLLLLDQFAKGHRVQDAVVGLRAFCEEARGKDLVDAVAVGKELLSRQAGYEALALALGRAQRRLGEHEDADELIQRYQGSESDDTEARVELARMLEVDGKTAEAYEVLKSLVADGSGTTAELERLASLALAAGKLEASIELFERAADREPEDLALRQALSAALARQCQQRIAELEGQGAAADKLELAACYAEAGDKDKALATLRAVGKIQSANPDVDLLTFSAEAFEARGLSKRAEAAWRQVAALTSLQPGSEQHLDLLYRIASHYEGAGGRERAAARRVFLEIYARNPGFKDVTARLEALSEDVRSLSTTEDVDERVLELVDVGAPLGTVFDQLQAIDLTLDPRLLAHGYKSSAEISVP